METELRQHSGRLLLAKKIEKHCWFYFQNKLLKPEKTK
jgi:hypothetical protein